MLTMYFAILALCFVVGPVVSMVIERAVKRNEPQSRDLLALVFRWFTFWIVGVRLFTAGMVQALRPEFTADQIFGTTDPTVLPFISELGYANIGFGVIGIISLYARSWVVPAALAGVVFLGLDGIRHAVSGGDFTADRVLAMVTDLIAVVVLGACLIAVAARSRQKKTASASADPAV
jgi:hypothetical protein